MLARALANGLCNRLPRETTRTVGLGATGRHDRQASTEVCTELGSLKTSSYANVKQLKIKVFAKPLQQAKYNFNANFVKVKFSLGAFRYNALTAEMILNLLCYGSGCRSCKRNTGICCAVRSSYCTN